MAAKKKGPAGATNTDKGQKVNNSSKSNIDEKETNIKEKSKKSIKLTLESAMRTVAIKIYEEQLKNGIAEFTVTIKGIDDNRFDVIAIIHNRDFQGDDFFEPSTDKQHIHLIARTKGTPLKLRTWLNMFGIKLRPDEDANLWEHAVQTAKQFDKYAAYLTHETKDAIEDGKAKYEMEELISNLSKEDIRAIQLPHIYGGKQQAKSVSIDEEANWFEIFRKAGYDMAPFDDLFESAPAVLQKRSERQLRRYYNRGQNQKIDEVRKSELIRCAIYIKGGENQGKTYAAFHAFDGMDKNIIRIDDATKTGKFDRLTALHNVMIVDDATVNNVLGMADDRPVECYRRNNENPWWCGEYFIVTSNLNFDDWCRECGIDNDRKLKAARSRFFICEVDDIDGQKYLRVDDRATRGQAAQLQKKIEMMAAFKKNFNNLIKQYNPNEVKVDDSILWADDPIPNMEQMAIEVSQQRIAGFRPTSEADCLPFG